MAVGEDEIGPAVLIDIEKGGAPAEQLIAADAGSLGDVFEEFPVFIAVERRAVAGEIGLGDIELPLWRNELPRIPRLTRTGISTAARGRDAGERVSRFVCGALARPRGLQAACRRFTKPACSIRRPFEPGWRRRGPPRSGSTGADAMLTRFQLSLLTEGSGTQVFATTFVQWAAREALRRAQPITLLARFTPRSARIR